ACDRGGDRFAHTPPETGVHQKAAQRQRRDQREHPYHFSTVNASGFRDSRCLKSAMTIARPTAASAAATVITKKTMICPSADPIARPKATNVRFTALSMISIERRIVIRFRRTKTPAVPIEKRIAERTR